MFAFYTCFFGDDTNERNFIPPVPTTKYDCYYFTNNLKTRERLRDTTWIAVFYSNELSSIMMAKRVKACPHMLKELRHYEATCYFDSALSVDGPAANQLMENIVKYSSYSICMARHPFISKTWLPSAHSELREAMLQPRYAVQKEAYEEYIKEQADSGLKSVDDIHFATGFIIRRNNMISRSMGEVWWLHISKTGILCQLSFFFVQQMFREHIHDIQFGACFSRWGY
jgi:hypothetical protein